MQSNDRLPGTSHSSGLLVASYPLSQLLRSLSLSFSPVLSFCLSVACLSHSLAAQFNKAKAATTFPAHGHIPSLSLSLSLSPSVSPSPASLVRTTTTIANCIMEGQTRQSFLAPRTAGNRGGGKWQGGGNCNCNCYNNYTQAAAATTTTPTTSHWYNLATQNECRAQPAPPSPLSSYTAKLNRPLMLGLISNKCVRPLREGERARERESGSCTITVYAFSPHPNPRHTAFRTMTKRYTFYPLLIYKKKKYSKTKERKFWFQQQQLQRQHIWRIGLSCSFLSSVTRSLALTLHWKHTKIIISAAICVPRNNNGKSLTYATFISLSSPTPLTAQCRRLAAICWFVQHCCCRSAQPLSQSPPTPKHCSQHQRQRRRQRQRQQCWWFSFVVRCLLFLLPVVTSICCKAHKKHKRVNKVNLIYFEYKLHFLRLPTAAANSSSSSFSFSQSTLQ